MKIALITTTINVPSVLALYRRFDPSAAVRFFVALDDKTPAETLRFLENIGNCHWLNNSSYKCDKIIGHNSIQRRNLALLEALKWGADIIVSIDDDNIPLDPNYFHQFEEAFTWSRSNNWYGKPKPFSGLCVKSHNGWFDPGQLLSPPVAHRGFPAHLPRDRGASHYFDHVVDAKIGVAAGMVLGDPDTSAIERLARSPRVSGVSEILKTGIVVDPNTWTVWNSQNTAIVRELAPAWSMWCGVSRYDDIAASLMVQRIMRDRGYHVHFGRPFVYQERNKHDLNKDLVGEMWGMQNIVPVAEILGRVELGGKSVVEDTRELFYAFAQKVPTVTIEAGLAFLEDCEKVLEKVL